MPVIFKYAIPIQDTVLISMPLPAKILHVALQDGEVFCWVLVQPGAQEIIMDLAVRGTGQPIESDLEYIGSVHPDRFVWHIFKRVR